MDRKLISSGSDFESKIGYSRAVVDGDYVFVSGTTGYNYETMSISDDVVEQAESLEKSVRVTYIFPDKADFEPCWPVMSKYLGEAKPAATVFNAGLLDDDMKLEIQITARIHESGYSY